MESLAENLIGITLDRLGNPSLLIAACVGFIVLISGLGARLIELGEAAGQTLTGIGTGTGTRVRTSLAAQATGPASVDDQAERPLAVGSSKPTLAVRRTTMLRAA